ncbi:MAG: hypothetical protein QG577_1992 [Thermodesulfobacteriota bacterium]|nr:hypothetical protein [Thermodesulfobacteriota bacterium]
MGQFDWISYSAKVRASLKSCVNIGQQVCRSVAEGGQEDRPVFGGKVDGAIPPGNGRQDGHVAKEYFQARHGGGKFGGQVAACLLNGQGGGDHPPMSQRPEFQHKCRLSGRIVSRSEEEVGIQKEALHVLPSNFFRMFIRSASSRWSSTFQRTMSTSL